MTYTLILLIIATLLVASPRFRKDSGVFYFEFYFNKLIKIRLWPILKGGKKTPPTT